jgi:uncharacterized membrane protein HdeD (DUF308 family)
VGAQPAGSGGGAATRPRRGSRLIFGATLTRGVLAVALGVALTLEPTGAKEPLLTFMGFYWLLAGLVSVRLGLHTRLPMRVIGLVGGGAAAFTGSCVVLRHVLFGGATEAIVAGFFGLFIFLTGLVRLLAPFLGNDDARQSYSGAVSPILGALEVVLGGAILAPSSDVANAFRVASIWAVLAGTLLVLDAFWMQREQSPSPGSQSHVREERQRQQ